MKIKYFFNKKMKVIDRIVDKPKLLLVAVCSSAVLFSGCQSANRTANISSNTMNANIDSNQGEDMDAILNGSEDESASVESNDVEAASSINLFSELSKYELLFSSGVGAWHTILNIKDDGTFYGYFSDSDMGDTGEGYPDGTVYSSAFEGKFTAPVRVNDYTYTVSIETIKLEKEVGTEEIIDGIRYVYSEPYGLNNAKEIMIYSMQAPIKELPEGFRNWVNMALSDEDEYLRFYGIYNVETEHGFSSYEIFAMEKDGDKADIIAEVAEIENQYVKMNERFKKEDLNQLEMNFLARDIYKLWDDEINKVWGDLKDTLDQDAMDNLTKVQKEWITWKEDEVKKAGSEYEGGSLQPMVEYLKGAELTRDRVYELIELL